MQRMQRYLPLQFLISRLNFILLLFATFVERRTASDSRVYLELPFHRARKTRELLKTHLRSGIASIVHVLIIAGSNYLNACVPRCLLPSLALSDWFRFARAPMRDALSLAAVCKHFCNYLRQGFSMRVVPIGKRSRGSSFA